jgi:type III pantothenate kinase
MILDIDIGNTRAKYRLTGGAAPAPVQACSHAELPQVLGALPLHQITAMRIASVAAAAVAEAAVREFTSKSRGKVIEVRSTARCADVTNSYVEPHRLGVDRWLAVIAAYNRWRAPCIVIDSGTALKIDVVDADGMHQGGWIVPGLGMLRSSLIAGTAAVRFDTDAPPSVALGCSTAEAVLNGTLSMAAAWLNASVTMLLEKYQGAHIVLCGGDAASLRSYLSFHALDWPDIVLDGLALIPLGD